MECPACYSSALTRSARRIARVVRAYHERVDRLDLMVNPELAAHHRAMAVHLNHFVLSVNPGKYPEGTDEKKIRAAAVRICSKVGIEGGMLAVHPWRIKENVKSRLGRICRKIEVTSLEEKEKKFWVLIREDILKLGSWRSYIDWSPHVHILGYGYLLPQTTPEEKQAFKKISAGWFVKKIKRGSGYDIEQAPLKECFDGQEVQDPVAATAYYILSHAALRKGRNLYVWFGFLNPQKLRKDGKVIADKVPVVCPKCNSPVVFGEDTFDNFIYTPGSKGDIWKPRLLNLQSQRMLIMGIDPPPEKKKNILKALPGYQVVAADVAPSSGSWLFDKWGMK